ASTLWGFISRRREASRRAASKRPSFKAARISASEALLTLGAFGSDWRVISTSEKYRKVSGLPESEWTPLRQGFGAHGVAKQRGVIDQDPAGVSCRFNRACG